MLLLFTAIVGVWVVIKGIKLSIGKENPLAIAQEFIFVIVASVLLGGQGPGLVNMIYQASLKMMGAAASVALLVGQTNGDSIEAGGSLGAGMEALVTAAEHGLLQIIYMAWDVAGEWSITNPLMILAALLLLLPYCIVLVVYFSHVVIAIFRIMMLSALSPYMMLGFGFGWGREMAVKGIKTVISSFMVLFGATAALAVMLYGVTALNVGAEGADVGDWASISNPDFILAVALGWMGTAFMTEATGIANSITESALTNTGAGIITAGASASALAAGKAIKSAPASQAAMGAASGAAGAVGSNAAFFAGKALGATPAGAVALRAAEIAQSYRDKLKSGFNNLKGE
ncbi:hypothetical protein HH303_18510 [Rhodospirillaceae bacterium KN72]|uniref:Uncharacterized protein n=1 Tax=Pacificispira spongiicola TaxID=2729598 RepID=A0A7Y0HG29_9PROT|nr:type IV secretion system protein [Pacificispira spongiicola]NMM46490.1 hypothetical protein [Pacificispira spongiicola]